MRAKNRSFFRFNDIKEFFSSHLFSISTTLSLSLVVYSKFIMHLLVQFILQVDDATAVINSFLSIFYGRNLPSILHRVLSHSGNNKGNSSTARWNDTKFRWEEIFLGSFPTSCERSRCFIINYFNLMSFYYENFHTHSTQFCFISLIYHVQWKKILFERSK